MLSPIIVQISYSECHVLPTSIPQMLLSTYYSIHCEQVNKNIGEWIQFEFSFAYNIVSQVGVRHVQWSGETDLPGARLYEDQGPLGRDLIIREKRTWHDKLAKKKSLWLEKRADCEEWGICLYPVPSLTGLTCESFHLNKHKRAFVLKTLQTLEHQHYCPDVL